MASSAAHKPSLTTLGDLVSVVKGAGYKGSELEDPEAEDRLLSITAIRAGGGFDSSGLRPYRGRHRDEHVFRPGDVAIALTDLTQDGGMLGSPARIPLEDRKLVASHHVARIFDFSDELSPDWLFYRLQSFDWAFRADAYASGTTVRQFKPEALLGWELELPPRNEQDRIVRILDSFAKKLTANYETRAAIRALISLNWRRARAAGVPAQLGELCELVKRGVAPSYPESDDERTLMIVNQRCIRDETINFIEAKRTKRKASGSDERMLRPGDLLVNSGGTGTLGRVSRVGWLPEEEVYADSLVTIIRSNPHEVGSYYLAAELIGRAKDLERLEEGSTGQTQLPVTALESLGVKVPGSADSVAFELTMGPLFEHLAALEVEDVWLSTAIEFVRNTLFPPRRSET